MKGVPPSDASNSGEGGSTYAAIWRLDVPRMRVACVPSNMIEPTCTPPFGGVPRPYRYASRKVVLGPVEEP